MPDNQISCLDVPMLDSDILKSIHEMRDFQREVLSFLEENQEHREHMLEFMSVMEKFGKQLDSVEARMHGMDKAVQPSEPSWNHLIPADLELGNSYGHLSELDPEFDLAVPGDVSGTAICPGSCGRPQCYCTSFEQSVGQYPPSASSGFIEPTTSQQAQSVPAQPLSPYELTSSFGSSTVFGGSTHAEHGPHAMSSGSVSELDQAVFSSGDPFFQHFRQLGEELGPYDSESSRFFPGTTIDKAFDTASGSQTESHFCGDSDEPCDLALSEFGDEDMGQQNDKGSECRAKTIQLPTAFTLLGQHLPGGIFDAMQSGGGPAP